MATLTKIEILAKEYSKRRDILTQKVMQLQRKIEELKAQRLPGIKQALRKAKEAEAKLKTAIEESPELFKRPRTVVFHGIKLGFQKGKGRIMWEDAALVVKLIKKHFPEKAELLIRVQETPNRQALQELSVQELKKIGVTVVETGDEVVIKAVDSEVDRIINALLKDEACEDVA